MNFKTTAILFVVLLIVGSLALYEFKSSTGDDQGPAKVQAHKLIDMDQATVKKLEIDASDGSKLALEKQTPDANGIARWRLTAPVSAPADTTEVASLISGILAAQSTAQVDASGDKAASFGLDKPQYKVELVDDSGKTVDLSIGSAQGIGSGVYVQLTGGANAAVSSTASADVVDTSILDAVGKQAKDLRDKKLVDVASSADIRKITLARPDGAVTLEKTDGNWKITAPVQTAADTDAASDIASKLSTLRAEDFVNDDSAGAAMAGAGSTPAGSADATDFGTPQLTVSFTAAAPAATPAGQTSASQAKSAQTSPPQTIVFGRYQDILKKNVLARVNGSTDTAVVLADTFDGLNKRVYDLRDKKVLTIDPTSATAISIAALNPGGSAAFPKIVQLTRRSEVVGPLMNAPAFTGPTTMPTTAPISAAISAATEPATSAIAGAVSAATQPATAPSAATALASAVTPATAPAPTTAPATPPTRWLVATGSGVAADADDSAVTTLLNELNPLKATKYLDPAATTNPSTATKYSLQITTAGPGGSPISRYDLDIVDPGGSDSPRAVYNGVAFEAPRSLVTALAADFKKKPGAVAAPATPPASSSHDPFQPTR
jgi:hypothetical protein